MFLLNKKLDCGLSVRDNLNTSNVSIKLQRFIKSALLFSYLNTSNVSIKQGSTLYGRIPQGDLNTSNVSIKLTVSSEVALYVDFI